VDGHLDPIQIRTLASASLVYVRIGAAAFRESRGGFGRPVFFGWRAKSSHSRLNPRWAFFVFIEESVGYQPRGSLVK
jgi:hypothetical protein